LNDEQRVEHDMGETVSVSLSRLERQLGYTFKDQELMLLALTHRSLPGATTSAWNSSAMPFSTSSPAKRCSRFRRPAKASCRARAPGEG
jgi:hypothetical protein